MKRIWFSSLKGTYACLLSARRIGINQSPMYTDVLPWLSMRLRLVNRLNAVPAVSCSRSRISSPRRGGMFDLTTSTSTGIGSIPGGEMDREYNSRKI